MLGILYNPSKKLMHANRIFVNEDAIFIFD